MNLTIKVTNPAHVSTGVAAVTVNGIPVDVSDDDARGALVPVGALADGAEIVVTLG